MFLGPPPGFPPSGGQPPAIPFGPQIPNHDRTRSNHQALPLIDREQHLPSNECRVGCETMKERPVDGRPSPLNLSSPPLKMGRNHVTSPAVPVGNHQGKPVQNVVRPSTSGTSSCHSSPSPKEHLSSSNISMVINSFQMGLEQVSNVKL